jgi:flavodoxin
MLQQQNNESPKVNLVESRRDEMKTLVAYMSQTGNTKKVAEAIYGAITEEKEIKELGDVDSLNEYDFAFVGFPIHAFGPAEPAKKFLETHAAGKKIALFITHAAPEESEEVKGWLKTCEEAASRSDVLNMFDCQGELAPSIMDMLLQSDDPNIRAFGELGPMTKGQPDEARLERARAFARETMEKAKG